MSSLLTDEYLFQNRHSKEVHDQVLNENKAFHDWVNERAVQCLKLHALQIETDHTKQLADNAQAILELETKKAEEDIRLREAENAKKLIPKPPPRVPTPPPQAPSKVERPAPTPVPTPPAQSTTPPPTLPQQPVKPTPPPPQQPKQPPAQQTVQPVIPKSQPINPFHAPQPTPHTITPSAPPTRAELAKPVTLDPKIAVLQQIHAKCKELRKYITTMPKEFRDEAGKMRRKIKMTMGQLVESGGNKQQTDTLRALFTDALKYSSETADPRLFMVARPEPVPGAKQNDPMMPTMFLYLMNIFSKAIVAQLISEASAKPAAAEPIGVLAHQIFSQPEFQWRNCAFVDILVAKYHVACPVLFGHTGNERTDVGRVKVGWKQDAGKFVSPQEHNERMVGLSAGYAALTLRNYGKTIRINPYAPHHYWSAIATIVNTDPDQVCPTQFTVLKALIENHAEKFVSFYGEQAMAALRAAVISCPACAKESTIAVKSLQVLADKWSNETGFYIG